MTDSKPYHHGDLRRTLIDASIALLKEVGASGFTLREVARRAGVAHTAAYRHFRDKQDLLAVVSEQGFDSLCLQLKKSIKAAAPPRDQLQAAGEAYVSFATQHPEEFRIMFGDPFAADVYPQTALAAQAAFGILLDLVQRCGFAGASDNDRVLTAARIAWAQMHGVAVLFLNQQFNLSSKNGLRKLVRASTQAIVNGL